jgi:hypothetical protein
VESQGVRNARRASRRLGVDTVGYIQTKSRALAGRLRALAIATRRRLKLLRKNGTVKRDAAHSLRAQPVDDAAAGRRLLIPASLIGEIERLLRSYRSDEESHEGIVYLAGREQGGESIVLCVLSPSAVTSPGSFKTNSDANASVIRALAKLSLTLVGQVHSHPGSWVGHSHGDDIGAMVRFSGYWSLVVPWFARNGMLPLTSCGIHLYQDGRFHQLSDSAVFRRVYLIPASIDLRGEG